GETTKNELYRVVRKDGQTRWSIDCAAPIHGADGRIIAAFVAFPDITDRKQAEEALRQSEEKYRAIFNSMPVGIFRTTVGGLLIDVNPTMARMLGYADSQHLLASTFDLGRDIYQRAEDRHSFIDALRASPEGVRMELKIKRLDGTPFYAIVNASL
ncbi:MAG: PAS domain-containing protein, partial [Humidesulfovibrio sp.]|nr:PAS domain-containing protein [Humidesulfovibrio sp.]